MAKFGTLQSLQARLLNDGWQHELTLGRLFVRCRGTELDADGQALSSIKIEGG